MIEKEKSSNLNREWMLKEIYNWNDSKEIIMKSEQKAYIVIKEKMSGYGGCNRIGGNFEQVNNVRVASGERTPTFGKSIAQTADIAIFAIATLAA